MWHSARGAAGFQGVALMMIQRVQNLIAGDKNSRLLLSTIHYTTDLPPASFCRSLLPGKFPTAAGGSFVPGAERVPRSEQRATLPALGC